TTVRRRVAAAPVEGPAPAEVATPAAPVAREERPRLRKVAAESIAMPPELQPRTMITREQQMEAQIAAAGREIAEQRRQAESAANAQLQAERAAASAERDARVAAARESQAIEIPELDEGPVPRIVGMADEVIAAAPSEAAGSAPAAEPVAVAEPATEAVAAAAPAEPAAAATAAAPAKPEDKPTAVDLGLHEIGKAIEATTEPLPSNRRVPRLKRLKMPDALVNIPKPAPRPKPAPSPAGKPAAGNQQQPIFDRNGRQVPESQMRDDGRRGRKVIYDRHRDSGKFGDRRRNKKRGKRQMSNNPAPVTVPKAEKRILKIEDTISVANLAKQMSVKATEVIRKIFDLGIMATINHTLDLDTVELVAADFGFTVQNVAFDLETFLRTSESEEAKADPRAPVVTVMGHVDHGKTSLLDRIRSARVAAREAGGITQHIGAYKIETPNGGEVVFLDTPGHEAFTAMRARGADATDVIVLVVAADDGVMPQTIEAINHGKAAKVPMIVAINKMDKPGADVERVRRELAEHNVVVEEWGGEVSAIEVSAKTGMGVDDLLETLALQAEVMELTASPEGDARGLVIEARLERGRGAVATMLIQEGTLKKGSYVVAGKVYGRVRAMMDDSGKNLKTAGPSTPVEIIGLNGIAAAGDHFYVTPDEKSAKAIVDHRIAKAKEKKAAQTTKVSLDTMFEQMEAAAQKDLNIIIKADVHGSAEALKQSLQRLEHADVKVRVLHGAVGGVTESDIQLGAASGAMILAFNVKPEAKGKRLADDLGVEILPFSVIYDALDHVMAAMEGMLEPIIEEVVHGHADVRAVFHIAKAGSVAGCYITDGKMYRNQRMRLTRGEDELWTGACSTLKRFKDDVAEVGTGYECGISLEGFGKFREGDVIECFEIKKIPRKLEMVKSYRPTGE
ncbi:MAG: translation initiation factor IF-2, partial [Myxococcales bacterium]|nr:translation initiation factor IF-2 [Myxococcales bacterium]